MSQPLAAGPPPTPVLRGSPQRHTDFMQELQLSYLRAIAAASGCIVSRPEIDDGIDVTMTHRTLAHTVPSDNVARLEVQLKATSAFAGKPIDFVSTTMRRDRWEYYRTYVNTVNKIVVIMSLPEQQENWTMASHDLLAIRHCAYWVNLANAPDSDAERPTVKAPVTQIFDDVSLCAIMARIGQGERP